MSLPDDPAARPFPFVVLALGAGTYLVALVLSIAVVFRATLHLDGAQQETFALKWALVDRLADGCAPAVLLGMAAAWFHRSWMEQDRARLSLGTAMLIAVPRAFVHFPFYGALLL
ncbi:MAG: hypothetical protein ACK4N5_05575, partial [Myxococcales bacterium]